jgi:alkylation response protein AidB-like acyl-CoA dehydrogenase
MAVADMELPPTVQPAIPAGDDFLSRAELAALTPEELVRRTTALKTLLQQHAAECERVRHPVTDVWNAIRATGCFYHFLPRKYGGLEFDVDSFLDAMLPLAEGCASTGWVAAFCVEHIWMLAQFPEQFQDEIFGGGDHVPYVIAPGVTAPPGKAIPVDGGYRISGRWKWGTGIMNSDWAMVACAIPDDPERRALFCALPTKDVTVLDTWYIDGMEGTGSHDLLIADVFIPEYRTMNMNDMRAGTSHGARLYDNPVYRQPMTPFLGVTAAIGAVGIGRAAVAAFSEQLRQRVIPGSTNKQSDKPAAQMRLGHANVQIATAEMLLRSAVNRNVELAGGPVPANFEQRSFMRLQIASAVEICRGAVRSLVEAAGAGAHMRGNPLQRHLRDVNVMSNHVIYDIDAASELHGRALLGMEPNSMIY